MRYWLIDLRIYQISLSLSYALSHSLGYLYYSIVEACTSDNQTWYVFLRLVFHLCNIWDYLYFSSYATSISLWLLSLVWVRLTCIGEYNSFHYKLYFGSWHIDIIVLGLLIILVQIESSKVLKIDVETFIFFLW